MWYKVPKPGTKLARVVITIRKGYKRRNSLPNIVSIQLKANMKAKKPFCGILLQFGKTPKKQHEHIIKKLFLKHPECTSYWREHHGVVAYYSHPYYAAQILETTKDYNYYITYYEDKKSRKRQPHILKVNITNEEFVTNIINQYHGVILDEDHSGAISIFDSPINAAEVLILLEYYGVPVKFAKDKDIKDLTEMFDFKTY